MAEPTTELQFETAEAASGPSEARCAGCNELLGSYFELNGTRTCPRCKEQLVAFLKAPHLGGLLRGAGLGIVAAGLGTGLYYGVAALTGYELGIISIAVGLLVGFAVRIGARGRGGWRYQALAMFLTYASIASSYMPGVLNAIRQHAASTAQKQGAIPAGPAASAPDGTAQGVRAGQAAPTVASGNTPGQAPGVAPSASASANAHVPKRSLGRVLAAVGLLFLLALATPFLAGIENVMGLVLIAIALYEAWKVNRAAPISITGPFDAAMAQSGG